MDQHLLWNKINRLIAYQKELDKFLFDQKHIVADLILRVSYLETKAGITEEDFNAYKKDFIAKHEAAKASSVSGGLQSKTPGTDVSNGEDSRPELPGEAGNGVHK